MSRRHLTFVVVAIASLVVGACSSSPTAPQSTGPRHDVAPVDTVPRIGTIGSSG